MISIITTGNLFFSFVILVFGIWVYKKKNNKVPLYIGIAFGLFRIWDIARIFDFSAPLGVEVLVRALAYCLVIFALYKFLKY